MSESLQGKVAWITGGGSGIGLAGGIAFARAGAHVVVSGRSAESAERIMTTYFRQKEGESVISQPSQSGLSR